MNQIILRDSIIFSNKIHRLFQKFGPKSKGFLNFVSNLIFIKISNKEIKRRNEEIELDSVCKLDDGTPIFLVDKKASFNELIEILFKCNKIKKEVIGIDAEWRPHFLSATERCLISLF